MTKPNLLFTLFLLCVANHGSADDDDHERALQAQRRGEILSLQQILEMHPLRVGERLLEVEIEREDGRWEYELEILGSNGRVRELELDGATGLLLDEDEED